MIDTAPRTNTIARPWPLTSQARRELIDEIARLRQGLSGLGLEWLEAGIMDVPASLLGRRLQTLEAVLERAEVVDAVPCAAIGRKATFRHEDGEVMSYRLVFPGDGDPARGQISADSPLGVAILGASIGESIDVQAPAGSWSVTLVAVE
jgi:hypothetical protein